MKNIEVVAAIINDGENVFSTQRGYGEFKGGWEFPGGKIEAGESQENALKREIKEELDIDIEVKKYIGTVNHDYENFHLIMHCYMCTADKNKIKLIEHEAARWLNKSTFMEVDWLPADIKILDAVKTEMKW